MRNVVVGRSEVGELTFVETGGIGKGRTVRVSVRWEADLGDRLFAFVF